ncbi:MAG: GIDE domain-containing protein [Deltaproteobacteria bacterium]
MVGLTIALVAVCVVVTMGWAVLAVRRDGRKLHELPRTPIRELVAGERVRVVGTARKISDDVGGIYTGTPCLATHGWISGDDDGNLSPPDDRVVAFRVEDDTGAITVSVGHTKLQLAGTIVDMAKAKSFGASIVARESGAMGGGFTYWEDRLDVDTRVAVIGYVVRGDDGALRLAGRENEPLVIANVSAAFE